MIHAPRGKKAIGAHQAGGPGSRGVRSRPDPTDLAREVIMFFGVFLVSGSSIRLSVLLRWAGGLSRRHTRGEVGADGGAPRAPGSGPRRRPPGRSGPWRRGDGAEAPRGDGGELAAEPVRVAWDVSAAARVRFGLPRRASRLDSSAISRSS